MRMIQNHTPQTRDPFQNLFTHLFRDSLGGLCDPHQSSEQNAPRTNIGETDSAYELSFELPGVEEPDIQVQLHEKTLTVTAERSSDVDSGESEGDSEDKDKKDRRRWHRVEHRYGRFSRAISLPTDAANDGVEAVYRAGVLTVTVPKQAEAQPARIAVRSA